MNQQYRWMKWRGGVLTPFSGVFDFPLLLSFGPWSYSNSQWHLDSILQPTLTLRLYHLWLQWSYLHQVWLLPDVELLPMLYMTSSTSIWSSPHPANHHNDLTLQIDDRNLSTITQLPQKVHICAWPHCFPLNISTTTLTTLITTPLYPTPNIFTVQLQ